MPAYAVVSLDMPNTRRMLTKPQFDDVKSYEITAAFLDDCQPCTEKHLIESSIDEMFKVTLTEAHRFADRYNVPMVERALKIRAFASRRIALQDAILSIPIVDDKDSMYHEQRPVPPYMEFQIDIMMNFVIDEHRTAVLKELKRAIFGSNAMEACISNHLLRRHLERLRHAIPIYGVHEYNMVEKSR